MELKGQKYKKYYYKNNFRIKVDRTPSDENIVGSVSPVSPCSPGLQPTRYEWNL